MIQGQIEANGTRIGLWSAERIGEIDDRLGSTYRCRVIMHPPCHPEHHGDESFEITHHYGDGAAVLAANVLWQYALRTAGPSATGAV